MPRLTHDDIARRMAEPPGLMPDWGDWPTSRAEQDFYDYMDGRGGAPGHEAEPDYDHTLNEREREL